MQIETMVRELWDRENIAKVPRAYSRGVDRRDWALGRERGGIGDHRRRH